LHTYATIYTQEPLWFPYLVETFYFVKYTGIEIYVLLSFLQVHRLLFHFLISNSIPDDPAVHSSVPAPLQRSISIHRSSSLGGNSSQWDVKFSLRREPHANARSINQFVLPINTTKYGQRSLPIMINGFTSLALLLLQSIWHYVILSLYIFTRPNEFN